MKKLFEAAEIYISRCKWQDMALLKCCLLAIGLMIGMGIPRKKKRVFRVMASVAFGFTIVPLVMKFYEACRDSCAID